MRYINPLALLLVIVGAVNWLLVGTMKVDLVAALTGSQFGETNPISTVVYALVGLAGIALIPTLFRWLSGNEDKAPSARREVDAPAI